MASENLAKQGLSRTYFLAQRFSSLMSFRFLFLVFLEWFDSAISHCIGFFGPLFNKILFAISNNNKKMDVKSPKKPP